MRFILWISLISWSYKSNGTTKRQNDWMTERRNDHMFIISLNHMFVSILSLKDTKSTNEFICAYCRLWTKKFALVSVDAVRCFSWFLWNQRQFYSIWVRKLCRSVVYFDIRIVEIHFSLLVFSINVIMEYVRWK